MRLVSSAIAACLAAWGAIAGAQEVRITPEIASETYTIDGNRVTIACNQDRAATIAEEFAQTSRACPPFCIHAMSAGEGIETVGELELMAFLRSHVEEGRGLLIDSRVPAWFAKGSIPGAINLPFTALEPDNPYRDEILEALGGVPSEEGWDFTGAMDLLMFCNGPWCDQSPRALANLRAVGYPAERLRYDRGGMQAWLMLGLTTFTPESAS